MSTFRERHGLPALGAGIGLRFEHVDRVLEERPPVPWFEIVSENYMGRGGLVRRHVVEAAAAWPIVCHGVSLNVGSSDPLDRDHLARLKSLCDDVSSPWASDHLCFTAVGGVAMNDLLPLPRTEEAARHVAMRTRAVQDALGRPFLLENVSSYLDPMPGQMSEGEFMSRITDLADCGVLLDVNNVHVNSVNFGVDPWETIRSYPLDRVVQLHLAGPEARGTLLIDTHGAPVQEEVWRLTERVLPLLGPTSVLVEWDNDVPALERLLEERDHAQALLDRAATAAPAR